jgi:hypothetical protein
MRSMLAWAAAATFIAGCGDMADRPPIGLDVSLAKGSGGAAPKVTAADPPSGAQGQRLNVRVLGSGFNPSAVASWERGGVVDVKITVHSTTFISSAEVVADITIADDSELDLYDIAVEIIAMDGSRKKGIGIEKFEVRAGPHAANSYAWSSGALLSDGLQAVNGTETDSTVHFALGGPPFRASTGFFITYSTFRDAVRLGQPPCTYGPGDKPGTEDDERRLRVFAKLIDPTLRGAFALNFTVYKPALGASSDSHRWSRHWNEGVDADSLFSMAVSDAAKSFPGVAPTATQVGPYQFRFTGGVVWINDRTGQPKNHQSVYCPNLDESVITWVPPVP